MYYRASMQAEAKVRNVKGWVRNRRDGSVEAMLQGETENVEEMISWAKKGPTLAKVERVVTSVGAGHFESFEALDTL